MAEITLVDSDELRQEVQDKYREVAKNPDAVGALAVSLGLWRFAASLGARGPARPAGSPAGTSKSCSKRRAKAP